MSLGRFEAMVYLGVVVVVVLWGSLGVQQW